MKNHIGIRKENKYPTEKRAPISPAQVEYLVREKKVKVTIEPSEQRVYRDEEYRQAGAEISEDLNGCNLIFGVKEIPVESFLPDRAYCFFSHTIKGQPYNMPMLQHILETGVTLIDYEKVTNEAGKRLIFFGPFAGYAGMINSLSTLGNRLKWEGLQTPFSDIQQARDYDSLDAARAAIRNAGRQIADAGLPEELSPLIIGFTGDGQVSHGAQEIFDLLPFEEIRPEQLEGFMKKGGFSRHLLYKVVFREPDMFRPLNPEHSFDLQEYYNFPENYVSKFEAYIPYLTVLVNGIYWDERYPRLLTKEFLRTDYRMNPNRRLRVVGDITCDIEGSIECNVKSTNSRNPVYVYEPLSDVTRDGWEGEGPVILAVDKLPSELPREATVSFGEALLPFVPALAAADFTAEFPELQIPSEMKRAVIAHQGQLTPDYRYLSGFLAPDAEQGIPEDRD